MEKLKIGVIGTGHMGKNHVRIISEDQGRFDFVGIYDNRVDTAEQLAKQYNVKAFNSIDELLTKVDAVVVAVPSFLHKEIGIKVAEHNVNALIEKPLCISPKDADILTQLFNEKKLTLQVGHVERFNPVFRELKRIVKSDDVFYIETHRYSAFSNSGRITDTSVVEDLMIHDIDLVCNLFEPYKVKSINARGEKIKTDMIDFATCLLSFDNNKHAVINASRVAQNKERSIVVHTKNSLINADLLNKTLTISKNTDISVSEDNGNQYKQEGVMQKVFIPLYEPLKQELVAFYDSVINNTPVEVSGVAGTFAVKTCEEIIKKINSNKE